MKVVTERLMHEEKKITEKISGNQHARNSKGLKCQYCHKLFHNQRNCEEHIHAEQGHAEEKAFMVKEKQLDSDGSDSESTDLVVCHVLYDQLDS